MGRPRAARGVSAECLLGAHGVSVGLPQDPMGCPYVVRGMSVGCPWVPDDVFNGCPRGTHGSSMSRPWVADGLPGGY